METTAASKTWGMFLRKLCLDSTLRSARAAQVFLLISKRRGRKRAYKVSLTSLLAALVWKLMILLPLFCFRLWCFSRAGLKIQQDRRKGLGWLPPGSALRDFLESLSLSFLAWMAINISDVGPGCPGCCYMSYKNLSRTGTSNCCGFNFGWQASSIIMHTCAYTHTTHIWKNTSCGLKSQIGT